MMTIIYILYVEDFSTYGLIWINTITILFIMFLRIMIHFSIFIYHLSCPIIFKINVSTYRIRDVSDTHIVSVHHKLYYISIIINIIIKKFIIIIIILK